MYSYFVSFKDFLYSKNIIITDEYMDSENISQEIIIKQLNILREFHKRTMNFDGLIIDNLENNTGKVVENFKIDIKRLKRDLKRIKGKPQNSFENKLSCHGEKFLKKAERCIDIIYKSNYYDILRRSMKRNEICIVDGGINNLRIGQVSGEIEIRSYKSCSYNFIEMDCYFLLKKLIKKYNFDWEKVIHVFCELEGLDSSSENIIFALLSYPSEFMKCCARYRENKKEWTISKYTKRLEKAINREIDISLI
ncbi:hypothetical protein CLTEP_11160 [Clostridium tepidiprofundi DSM 19306]|uniref:Spore coat protein n=1 Tax=Clostridium tepidiprofundi DSM 19306 TaxID=1121338 RepID=A0A151B5A4_9CLOT|nr:hypothetical protein [Clostridium tepidiprofundi]KYH34952.1 hypothetical protein CLTEP_11160 [Clostridium tepidiprofundi DSM 19306]